MALSDEMAGPMTISSVAWQRGGSSGSASGTYNNFKLYMGLCSSSELTSTFADNYIPGSRVLVYETASQVMSAGPDEWMTITLDTPFWYNGEDNLILELEWQGGANMFYTYMWETGASRGLIADYPWMEQGTLSTSMSELGFDGDLGFVQVTFGAIKTLFAN